MFDVYRSLVEKAVPWTQRSLLKSAPITQRRLRPSMMLCCGNREHGCRCGRPMTTTGVASGTARHRQIGSLSERLPIWTTDMDAPSLPAMRRSPHARALASTGRALRRLGHRMAECRRKRRGYQELAAMSDLELEDLGISRSDIDAIFAGIYERAKTNSPNVIALDQRGETRASGNTRPCKRDGRNPGSQR